MSVNLLGLGLLLRSGHGRLVTWSHVRSTSVRLHSLALSLSTLAVVLLLLLHNSDTLLLIREERGLQLVALEHLRIGFIQSILSNCNISCGLSGKAQESHGDDDTLFCSSQVPSDLSKYDVEIFIIL